MYRDRVALGGQRVDCIAIQYIVLQQSGLAGIALQYNTMYCDRKGSLRLGSVSRGRPRYGMPARTHGHDTALARGTVPTIRRWERSRRAGRASAGTGRWGTSESARGVR